MTQVPAHTLEPRIAGSYGVDTQLFLTVASNPTTYWDLSSYTGWQIEAALNDGSASKVWTKNTGITGAAGSASTPSLTIVWLVGDMGALTAGDWKLEVTGTTAGSKPVKFWLFQHIDPEVS